MGLAKDDELQENKRMNKHEFLVRICKFKWKDKVIRRKNGTPLRPVQAKQFHQNTT